MIFLVQINLVYLLRITVHNLLLIFSKFAFSVFNPSLKDIYNCYFNICFITYQSELRNMKLYMVCQ